MRIDIPEQDIRASWMADRYFTGVQARCLLRLHLYTGF